MAIGLLYAIGFGAKEGAVTLPGILFLLDAARRDLSVKDVPRYLAERWRVYVTLVAVATAMLVARKEILGTIADPLVALGADLLLEIPRIWTVSEIWGNYVRLWSSPWISPLITLRTSSRSRRAGARTTWSALASRSLC